MEERDPDLLKLGLLYEVGVDTATVMDQLTFLFVPAQIFAGIRFQQTFGETTGQIDPGGKFYGKNRFTKDEASNHILRNRLISNFYS